MMPTVMSTVKLLLVEDDASMQAALQRALGRRGMEVFSCTDGRQALAQWKATQPDVVVLDLTLPGLDGLQVLAQARGQGLTTPVLILTARGTVGDRIVGLNTGADDYLPKPFDLDELEARLRALGRRRPAAGAEPGAAPQLVGHLRYDRESGAIYHRDQVLELTPRELALLQTLIGKLGHAVSKERLFELVFPGETDVQYEAVEVVVYRLRKKLAQTGVTLVTLRGLGYLLKVDA
ncbi:response regulator with CheY-like receiver domain and winged-helix DNA-binding domain [Polaromonas sp. CF318]|uniref:response regulator transcription factor n=1 Tax=Polaromonas sp. CF318 TaxID=1144318 RepID=UPI000270EAC6|nr:response regulator transcription factor [Polaromonas sp. CF318]EJL82457.1 response regulator with CheY-like receiver domain and winged-helix DNA-binding domain [Polaromonas sp. CF318]